MRLETVAVRFPGGQGAELAGRLERPAGIEPKAVALFVHCFACAKGSKAAVKVSRELAAKGMAVLRFDMTGLGESGGDFKATTFSGHAADVRAAAAFLSGPDGPGAPSLLIGHSLGGTAALAAAGELPSVKALATIGSPADPAHLLGHAPADPATGERSVKIGNVSLPLSDAFVEDAQARDLSGALANLKRALLVLQAPLDSVVGVAEATKLFAGAKHPKSFVGLEGADHLLTGKGDAAYAASVIAAWAERHLDLASKPLPAKAAEGEVVVEETGEGRFQQHVLAGDHLLLADEPAGIGGGDTGPTPYDLLLAALGACTSMTVRMYAARKRWPLERVRVTLSHRKVHARDCEDCETKDGKIDEVERTVELRGELDDEQRAKLLEIADKCPVHRTLESEVKVRTSLSP